jgi:hypothetical protein
VSRGSTEQEKAREGLTGGEAARRYYERTKHSYASVRRTAHFLDWENRPNPFKENLRLEPLPPPPDLEVAAVDALESLARLLRWGAGVAHTRTLPGGDVYHFRTYASAGALHPIELYVA